MACQICEAKCRFYTFCPACNKRKNAGEFDKCGECGKWKERNLPFCKDCALNNKKGEEGKLKAHTPSKFEQEDTDFRTKWPTDFLCADGHRVRSKSEKIIDDWLYNHKIVHAYEKQVHIEGEKIFCDFFLDYEDKVWIEFWGLNDEKYVARKNRKKELYAKTKRILIELSEKDIERIEDVLPGKLRPYLPKGFNFD